MKTLYNSVRIVLLLTVFTSCSDDNLPKIINEEEIITSVKLTFTETGTDSTQIITWEDFDAKHNITIENNKSYNVKIEFLDKSNPNDIDNITEEIIDKKDEHFIFYESTVSGLSIKNATDDTIDSNNIGINISTDWSFTASTSGLLKVYLIHEPISKTGNSKDDFGGETEIEITFDVKIK